VNPRTGEEVPYENLIKGYEIGPDRYVVISPEEIEALEPEKSRTIDIEDFVDLEQIDPIYYDHPYYLIPDTGAEKAYRLLLDAMDSAGKVAIARVVLRSKENLVAIRPRDGVMAMETMLFADEVVPPESLDDMPAKAKKTTKRELEMAEQLIESLTSEFDPERYRDEYRDRVLELIERKAQGEEIVVDTPTEEPKKVPDLMAALEASIAASKSPGGRPKKSASRSNSGKASSSSSNGAKKKSSGSGSSRRKTAKKS
ncbi:MAG: Ku protein, partial [Thermoleophilaceae bacterium]|nr:Ku protein [Thermoleophilaceae bacterium]